jgi:DNA transformation protein
MAVDPDYAAELFQALGPVRCRNMFGGTGIYAGELMFALEAGGVLYLKSDRSTDPFFEAEGCEAFSYETRDGRRTIMSYRCMPDRLFDDPDALAVFARRALAVARAAKDGKPKHKHPARRS